MRRTILLLVSEIYGINSDEQISLLNEVQKMLAVLAKRLEPNN